MERLVDAVDNVAYHERAHKAKRKGVRCNADHS
jgi:hypothetical protein